MGNDVFETIAKQSIVDNLEFELGVDDLYVVWIVKTLSNNKALISTDKVNGIYFEVTHNGSNNELYIDYYSKVRNICVKL